MQFSDCVCMAEFLGSLFLVVLKCVHLLVIKIVLIYTNVTLQVDQRSQIISEWFSLIFLYFITRIIENIE